MKILKRSLHYEINGQTKCLLQELQTVQRAISSKTTIPILTGVKIVLSEDGLSLTGSNADISIESF